MNTLGATSPGPRAATDAAASRPLGLDGTDEPGALFGAVLGALRAPAAPEAPPAADPERAAGRRTEDEAEESTLPGARPDSANPLSLLAAVTPAPLSGAAPARVPVRDSLETLVARALPNPPPVTGQAAPMAEPAASAVVPPALPLAADRADLLTESPVPDLRAGMTETLVPAAPASVPEARTRVTVLRRETHFAPVLPRRLAAGPIETVPARSMPAASLPATPLPEGAAPASTVASASLPGGRPTSPPVATVQAERVPPASPAPRPAAGDTASEPAGAPSLRARAIPAAHRLGPDPAAPAPETPAAAPPLSSPSTTAAPPSERDAAPALPPPLDGRPRPNRSDAAPEVPVPAPAEAPKGASGAHGGVAGPEAPVASEAAADAPAPARGAPIPTRSTTALPATPASAAIRPSEQESVSATPRPATSEAAPEVPVSTPAEPLRNAAASPAGRGEPGAVLAPGASADTGVPAGGAFSSVRSAAAAPATPAPAAIRPPEREPAPAPHDRLSTVSRPVPSDVTQDAPVSTPAVDLKAALAASVESAGSEVVVALEAGIDSTAPSGVAQAPARAIMPQAASSSGTAPPALTLTTSADAAPLPAAILEWTPERASGTGPVEASGVRPRPAPAVRPVSERDDRPQPAAAARPEGKAPVSGAGPTQAPIPASPDDAQIPQRPGLGAAQVPDAPLTSASPPTRIEPALSVSRAFADPLAATVESPRLPAAPLPSASEAVPRRAPTETPIPGAALPVEADAPPPVTAPRSEMAEPARPIAVAAAASNPAVLPERMPPSVRGTAAPRTATPAASDPHVPLEGASETGSLTAARSLPATPASGRAPASERSAALPRGESPIPEASATMPAATDPANADRTRPGFASRPEIGEPVATSVPGSQPNPDIEPVRPIVSPVRPGADAASASPPRDTTELDLSAPAPGRETMPPAPVERSEAPRPVPMAAPARPAEPSPPAEDRIDAPVSVAPVTVTSPAPVGVALASAPMPAASMPAAASPSGRAPVSDDAPRPQPVTGTPVSVDPEVRPDVSAPARQEAAQPVIVPHADAAEATLVPPPEPEPALPPNGTPDLEGPMAAPVRAGGEMAPVPSHDGPGDRARPDSSAVVARDATPPNATPPAREGIIEAPVAIRPAQTIAPQRPPSQGDGLGAEVSPPEAADAPPSLGSIPDRAPAPSHREPSAEPRAPRPSLSGAAIPLASELPIDASMEGPRASLAAPVQTEATLPPTGRPGSEVPLIASLSKAAVEPLRPDAAAVAPFAPEQPRAGRSAPQGNPETVSRDQATSPAERDDPASRVRRAGDRLSVATGPSTAERLDTPRPTREMPLAAESQATRIAPSSMRAQPASAGPATVPVLPRRPTADPAIVSERTPSERDGGTATGSAAGERLVPPISGVNAAHAPERMDAPAGPAADEPARPFRAADPVSDAADVPTPPDLAGPDLSAPTRAPVTDTPSRALRTALPDSPIASERPSVTSAPPLPTPPVGEVPHRSAPRPEIVLAPRPATFESTVEAVAHAPDPDGVAMADAHPLAAIAADPLPGVPNPSDFETQQSTTTPASIRPGPARTAILPPIGARTAMVEAARESEASAPSAVLAPADSVSLDDPAGVIAPLPRHAVEPAPVQPTAPARPMRASAGVAADAPSRDVAAPALPSATSAGHGRPEPGPTAPVRDAGVTRPAQHIVTAPSVAADPAPASDAPVPSANRGPVPSVEAETRTPAAFPPPAAGMPARPRAEAPAGPPPVASGTAPSEPALASVAAPAAPQTMADAAPPAVPAPLGAGPRSAPDARPEGLDRDTARERRAEAALPAAASEADNTGGDPVHAAGRATRDGEAAPRSEPVSSHPALVDSGSPPASGAPVAPPAGASPAGAPPLASTPPTQQLASAILGQMPRAPSGTVPHAPGLDGPLRLLTLQLHPADLGMVQVRMRLRDGHLEMSLQASREETATLLREGGEVLAELLRQGGYQPERVTIVSGPLPNGSVTTEGQAFAAQGEAGANSDQATHDQPDRRPSEGRATPDTSSERNHESVSNSPDRSGVYL